MLKKTVSLQIQNVLYVLEANKRLFLLIAAGQRGSMSTTTNKGTTISLNGAPYIVGLPKSGRLHSFDMELIKNKNEVPRAIIATISDYTLWHRRMGHAHQRVIKHLGKNTEGCYDSYNTRTLFLISYPSDLLSLYLLSLGSLISHL